MICAEAGNIAPERDDHKIKVVIWDLDHTLWHGVLLEDDTVTLRDGVVNIIKALDSRGILQSISSKNDYDSAMVKLKQFGISHYFIYEQINWNAKSVSIRAIAESINIGLDTVAFIDDQSFEREEVAFSLPDVLCIDAAKMDQLLDMPEMNPHFVTDDTHLRRHMYQSEIKRKNVESQFEGPQDEFLASLNMVLTIAPAKEEDLKRAEELTIRTHQLNTTGYTYSYDELNQMRKMDQYKLLVAGLEDKYGTYGKIGLVLIECREGVWLIKLLLMSCRVMSRGVATIIISYIRQMAKQQRVKLQAAFISNDRNRMMYITYGFSGFREVARDGDYIVFENDLSSIQPYPAHVVVNTLQ